MNDIIINCIVALVFFGIGRYFEELKVFIKAIQKKEKKEIK